MAEPSDIRAARAEPAGAIDHAAGAVALAAAIAFVVMAVALGPCEAMERLAVLLRKVLPFWGR